ncbi:MAG: ThuA domain-containing protein [Verrucomicrobia bacterium]|nr:ThuA domain-containing protein [Verrucomicrobiota bacterium]MDA1005723.1 ThuA domain-containing protein [Verrucomicrobiota bacterium]
MRIQQAITMGLVMLASAAAWAGKTKVLYVTHEPGTFHKYTPQMAIFKEIGEKAGWEVTVMTGEHEAQIEKLRTKDFAKGYDAVVYNFCFAGSRDLEAAANIMEQTRVNGVPALLIHCAMHCWWDTYRNGAAGAIGADYKGEAKAKPELVEEWNKTHPDKGFPAWGDFTGVASARHGAKKPITMSIITKDHPITKRFPDGFTTGNTELYNNIYMVEGVVPLIKGVQGEDEAVVVWTCPQGKSQVMGLSTGHDVGDWKAEPFQNLIIDGINHLTGTK